MPKALKPIEIKISTVVAVSVLINTPDFVQLTAALEQVTGGAPDYFDGEFAVIDVRAIGSDAARLPWSDLVKLLKSCGLKPVAVRSAPPEAEAAIAREGLALDSLAPRELVLPAVEHEPEVATVEEVAPPATSDSLVIEGPVRTGNRIYAQGRDLIVMGGVSPGAEIIADGNVHVYGALRGRALAGAAGNQGARIFAMAMEAELVSIAGVYRTFESASEFAGKGGMQIRLSGERIDITPIGN